MEKKLTVAWKGLWVLVVALLLTAPTLPQEEPQSSATPKPALTPAVLAPPDSESSTPAPAPQKKRPKTVGELLLGEGGGPMTGESDGSVGSTSSVQPSTPGKFVLRDPKPVPEHWATEGRVGKSTFFDQLVRMCWSLAVVSLLVWVVAKVAEKAGFKEMAAGPASKSLIEILEKKRLSPGRTIMIMRVGPKVLAVAATEKGYETLTEIDGEQFKNYQDSISGPVATDEAQSPKEGMTPGDVLRHYLSAIPGTGAKK